MASSTSCLDKAYSWIYNRAGWFLTLCLFFFGALLLAQSHRYGPYLSTCVSLCLALPVVGIGYAFLLMYIWRKVTSKRSHFPITVITYFVLSGTLCLFLGGEAFNEHLASEPEPSPNLHLLAIEARLGAIEHSAAQSKDRTKDFPEEQAIKAQKEADDADSKDKTEKPPHSYSGALYFTTITFTTVGYGDVLPDGSYGRIFACFVALLGTTHAVFFVTMIVARLTENSTVKPPKFRRRRR